MCHYSSPTLLLWEGLGGFKNTLFKQIMLEGTLHSSLGLDKDFSSCRGEGVGEGMAGASGPQWPPLCASHSSESLLVPLCHCLPTGFSFCSLLLSFLLSLAYSRHSRHVYNCLYRSSPYARI